MQPPYLPVFVLVVWVGDDGLAPVAIYSVDQQVGAYAPGAQRQDLKGMGDGYETRSEYDASGF